MHITHGQRGSTLIEALVAVSLLLTLAGGIAHLILFAHRFSVRAEQVTVATVAALAQVESLRAVPWEIDVNGVPRDAAALSPSPAGAMDGDTAGYFQLLDIAGRPTTRPEDGAPAYVRRWAIVPLGEGESAARALEVCVYTA